MWNVKSRLCQNWVYFRNNWPVQLCENVSRYKSVDRLRLSSFLAGCWPASLMCQHGWEPPDCSSTAQHLHYCVCLHYSLYCFHCSKNQLLFRKLNSSLVKKNQTAGKHFSYSDVKRWLLLLCHELLIISIFAENLCILKIWKFQDLVIYIINVHNNKQLSQHRSLQDPT